MPKASQKLDLYKIHKTDYQAPKNKPVILTTTPARYLTVTGKGEPAGTEFADSVAALYNVAFTTNMQKKKSAGTDYVVCKLEAVWWGSKGKRDFYLEPAHLWNWKLIIRTPDNINEKDLADTIQKLRDKGKPEEVSKVKLETMDEGLCVQMLHIGSYDNETETLTAMIEYAREQGYIPEGYHHEIYLSDPRKTAPDKLRTILRQPLK